MKILNYFWIFTAAVLLSACSVSRYAVNQEYPMPDNSYEYNGILEECFYKCSVNGPKERRMFVYLPSDYYESKESYPVMTAITANHDLREP